MSFDLLSEPIRRYIRDKRWEELRPIQNAAIQKILSSDQHYILASRTASGKTEAAFLPILSKVNFYDTGVQVLYISPLIALINDQFVRIEELCKYLEVTITKWHGEASRSSKEKLLKNPEGIVLITPESIEAMFVNKPYHVKQLFSNLKYVVIDEIHSFIGTDRGIQLQSLLYRLKYITNHSFSIVGLSATIGDYIAAKKFTGESSNTTVLLDKTGKEVNAVFRYFSNDKAVLPIELMTNLYHETKNNKVLIFPNSRGKAEEIAVGLLKLSKRLGGHANYFSHHSSVHKEVREFIESFAKNNVYHNFCISCTSTLELGIDIGTVDEVVQLDATYSIASLIQRVGRSGRKNGAASNLFLYATDKWSLLQSLACWTLYKEGFIEPPQVSECPYDILVHQILSIVKSYSGINYEDLLNEIAGNIAFSNIPDNEINEIVQHLISIDQLEKLNREIILGIEGEKIVNSRDFYSVFKAEENYKVINGGVSIGEIPFSTQIIVGENIFLAARIWKIQYVDHEVKRIEVGKANDGKAPLFPGGEGIVHDRIRSRMFELMYTNDEYDFLDENAMEEIRLLRRDFSIYPISEIIMERPLFEDVKQCIIYTFSGTRVNRTLKLLFDMSGVKSIYDDKPSTIEISLSSNDLVKVWKHLSQSNEAIDLFLNQQFEQNPSLIDFSKWGYLLPIRFQIKLLKEKYYDFQNIDFLLSSNLIVNNRN